MTTERVTPPAGTEDKVRKDLVQVFFGLVLTQIAVYISSLVDIWDGGSPRYFAAWAHIIFAFAVTTTSWFGWQMSVQKSRLDKEASVFQGGFILSLLDILLVTLYFLLVHKVEMTGVAAFPPKPPDPSLSDPTATAEVVILLIVFLIYAVWDAFSWKVEGKEYGPWPSVMCAALTLLAFFPNAWVTEDRPLLVIFIDGYLFGLVFFFRALKRLQKWNAHNNQDTSTFRIKEAPRNIQIWVAICGTVSVICYLIAVMLTIWG